MAFQEQIKDNLNPISTKILISFFSMALLCVIAGYVESQREGDVYKTINSIIGQFNYGISSIIITIIHTLISLVILSNVKNIWVIISYNFLFFVVFFLVNTLRIEDFIFRIYPILLICRVILLVIDSNMKRSIN